MVEKNKKLKVVFSGGGTLGSVTPLISVYDAIKEKYPNTEFFWVGTKNGPEKVLIEDKGIRFLVFFSGKLRRYVSLYNIIDLFKIIIGFFESLIFLKKEKPDLCISAGGFVSVSLHWATRVITTALEQNSNYFPIEKTVYLGNPVRQDILDVDKQKAIELFGISRKKPIVLVTGGGTGSENVNRLVADSVEYLKDTCDIIHLSGKDRSHELLNKIALDNDHYKTFSFLQDEMKHAYAVADLVISRGGFGTLTELSILKKPAIIIPIPGHQEENVAFLAKSGAVILVDQSTCTGQKLASIVKDILGDKESMQNMSEKLSKLIRVSKKQDILNIFEKIIIK